jgi:hypothetical protein
MASANDHSTIQHPGRVGTPVQRDPVRRASLLAALAAGGLTMGWLVLMWFRDAPEIYQAHGLSRSHQLFEHRCEVCHEAYAGPVERLLDPRTLGSHTSAPDARCLACHAGPGHFFVGGPHLTWAEKSQSAQLLAPNDRQCSQCHREHAGEDDLRRLASNSCRDCHSDLQRVAALTSGGALPSFQNRGTQPLSEFADHPQFALMQQLQQDSIEPMLPPSHGASQLLARLLRPGESEPRWQDRSRLRFNHRAHLRPADARGLADATGQFHDLSQNCQACHEPDSEKRYMQPVSYEKHCRSCHPLVFDPELVLDPQGRIVTRTPEGPTSAYPPAVVPHRSPAEVRAFLVNTYLGSLAAADDTASAPLPSPTETLPRPGRTPEPATAEQLLSPISDAVSHRLAAAESFVRFHPADQRPSEANSEADMPAATQRDVLQALSQSRRWLTGAGGCGFCHELTDRGSESAADAEQGVISTPPAWDIVPTQIPERWFPHAKFHHDAHRLMNCVECHSAPLTPTLQTTQATGLDPSTVNSDAGDRLRVAVFDSTSTGDVLMPSLELCQSCHTPQAQLSAGRKAARDNCTECHDYHQRQFETQQPHPLAINPGVFGYASPEVRGIGEAEAGTAAASGGSR